MDAEHKMKAVDKVFQFFFVKSGPSITLIAENNYKL
jgi:hypothetical protein